MQHSMTAKAGIRYRYYCCHHTDHEGRSAGSGRSVPAAALESFVIRQLQQLYQEQHMESRVIEDVQTEIPSRVYKDTVLRDWNRLGPAQKRYLCESVIERLEHHITEGVIVLRLRKDSQYGRGTAMADEHRIPFHVRVGRYGKKRFVRGPSPVTPGATHGRVPLVTRLLALAIHFSELRHQGAVENQTEMASIGRVTRARVSQIMNLVNLAPSIQEQILLWPRVSSGRDPFVLRELLPICTTADWSIQLDLWRNLLASRLG